VNWIVHVLIGDLTSVGDVAIKTWAIFLTAAILFRFTERRTLAEFAPFDWIAAVAAGAIVGRAATATDTAWLQATTALLCLLAAHAVLARLRLIPALCRFIDPPLMVLISDGEVNRRNLRRCAPEHRTSRTSQLDHCYDRSINISRYQRISPRSLR
jgi:uncharacterized membrane protein YcaP (DUF421 family)